MSKDDVKSSQLVIDVISQVEQLERGWSYLSEEVDRWNASFEFETPAPTEPGSFDLIRVRVRDFERTRARALEAGLGEDDAIQPYLARGQQLADDIRQGRFLSLRRQLHRAGRRHRAPA